MKLKSLAGTAFRRVVFWLYRYFRGVDQLICPESGLVAGADYYRFTDYIDERGPGDLAFTHPVNLAICWYWRFGSLALDCLLGSSEDQQREYYPGLPGYHLPFYCFFRTPDYETCHIAGGGIIGTIGHTRYDVSCFTN